MKSLLFLTLALVASIVSAGVIENTKDFLECPMENVNFSGEDLIWFDAGIETWNECGELCNNAVLCKYWTWINEKCYLKYGNDGMANAQGYISGEKGCM